MLRYRHQLGPGVRVREQRKGRAHREVGGRHLVQVLPGEGERDRRTGADPRAVCRDDRGTANSRGVEEHLAAAVRSHESRRRQRRIEALGPHREGARGGRGTSSIGVSVIGMTTCRPFAPLVFTAPAMPTSASADATRRAAPVARLKGPPSGGSMSSTMWVGRSQRSLRTSVGWYSTARWFANHSRVRRSSQSAYVTSRLEASAHSETGAARGRVLRQVLLHERLLSAQHPDDRQGTLGELGQNPV